MMRWIVVAALSVVIQFHPALLEAQSPAPPAAPAVEPQATEKPLSVEEAVICREVVDRVPMNPGDEFEATVGQLYCFTKITGAEGETGVKHVWYHGDKMFHEQELPVQSASWRTWSSKTIPAGLTGTWSVKVTDRDGTVLKSLSFEVQ